MPSPLADLAVRDALEGRIFLLRGARVMLDRHLAELYGVTTMALNQAVKRNGERFPPDFVFRLTSSEKAEVITICDNLRPLRFARSAPNAFTENGVAMLSSVLRGRRAALVNVRIMREFTRLRRAAAAREEFVETLEGLRKTTRRHDRQIRMVLDALRALAETPDEPRVPIGFRPDGIDS
ncbi:MAG: ORF6N domain-containing protein [Elusimicrobia bacterium]|nr:ORF6N domain-containing protein [Elusimicrobiota bacterium]